MIYAGRYVYLALLLVGGAYVGMAHAALPAAVAVHFDAQGHPNGWMNPTSYLVVLTVVGVVIPLGVVALVSFLGYQSPGLLNLPHRTERLAPANRAEAARRIQVYVWWLPVLMLALALALDVQVVTANRNSPPRLATGSFLAMLAAFLGGLAFWIVGWFKVLRFGPAE